MPDLAKTSGGETVKVLVGAVQLPRFTVAGLAERVEVSRRTVDTVLRRYGDLFERVGLQSHGQPGRPAVEYRLGAAHVEDVIALVETLRGALSIEERAGLVQPPEPDLVAASLEMAATSLGRILEGVTPDAEAQLLMAARDSLAGAGFDFTDDAPAQTPDTTAYETAAFINGVADIVEARGRGDAEGLDTAQAQALRLVRPAGAQMRADHWLPLVQIVTSWSGSVIMPLLLVFEQSEALVRSLFPSLRRDERSVRQPGYVTMSDPRAPRPGAERTAATPLLVAHNAADLRPLRRRIRGHQSLPSPRPVVIGGEGLYGPVTRLNGRFVLQHGDPGRTRIDTAAALNRLTFGLDS